MAVVNGEILMFFSAELGRRWHEEQHAHYCDCIMAKTDDEFLMVVRNIKVLCHYLSTL